MYIIGAILRWAVLGGYLAGAFLYIAPFLSPGFRRGAWAAPVLRLTVLGHALLLLETAIEYGRLTFLSTALGATTLYALVVALAALALEHRFRNASFGAFAVPLAAFLYILSLIDRQPHIGVDPLLDSYWFEVHVTTAFLGYAAFGVACVAGVMYLMLAGSIRSRRLGAVFERMPSLGTLDMIGSRAATIGLGFLTVGLVTGAVWSYTATGRAMSGEPKEYLAGLTWALFALEGTLRWRAGWQGRRPALLSIVGFVASIVTFLGGGSGRHTL
jgi:ABC-type transport system involved in cytochrome c biogenesis permease subunit